VASGKRFILQSELPGPTNEGGDEVKGSDVLKALEEGKRVANSVWDEGNYWYMKRGIIYSVSPEREAKPSYVINDLYHFGGEWIVLPEYVPFSDAMKAVEEGRDVVCNFNDKKITIRSYTNKVAEICEGGACSSGGAASIKIAWIVAGKWEIKEETK
jgi:hypothetical protein